MIDHLAARNIDQQRPRLERGQRGSADQAFGFGRQRASQRHDIGLRERLAKVGLGDDLIGDLGLGPCRAAHADHPHVERLRQGSEAHADAAEADNDQRLAAELLLAQRAIADHAAPLPRLLVIARLMKLTRKGENERHGMFRHRAFVGALSVGQSNAMLGEQRPVILIRAGAEGLNEAKLGRTCQQRVAPQAGQDEHIGFMRASFEVFQRPHLKVRDAGLPGGEFLRCR